MDNEENIVEDSLQLPNNDGIMMKVEITLDHSGQVVVKIPDEYQEAAAISDIVFMLKAGEQLMINHYFASMGDKGNEV